jgi:SAM-dependent methyltransferase
VTDDDSSPTDGKPSPTALREAVLTRLNRHVRTTGEIALPAAPSLFEVYIERFVQLFVSLGKALNVDELARLRELLEPRLIEGFATSSSCRVHVKWEAEAWPGTGLDYRLWLETASLQEQYEQWAASKEPPLFGAHPDAKVMAVAESLGTLAQGRAILDVGAGTGRNTLPLARAGHTTHALEMTEPFCVTIESEASAQQLPVQVLRGSALAAELALGHGEYALVVCSEVTTHFRSVADLRTLFERAAECLCAEGLFLVNAFIAVDGYEPDVLAREVSQIVWSMMYTRDELAAVCEGLPFELVSDEEVYTHEKQQLPPENWPPTGWFEDWARGYNCFGLGDSEPPMRLRWLLFRKR